MSELKNCPFCGGEAYHGGYDAYSCDSSFSAIVCDNCGLYMDSDSESREESASRWNTRADAEAKRQAINELLALHEQDRAKVNSQCDTLINMSTVMKYLEGLE